MRARSLMTLILCLPLVAGCDDTAGSDAGPAADATADGRLDDPEAGPEPDMASETAPDMTSDMAPDGPIPDAMSDSTPLDAEDDMAPPDMASPDAAAPDAVVDMEADAAPDAQVDGGPPFVGEGVCDPETVIPLAPIDRRTGSTVGAPAGAEPGCSEGGGASEVVFTWVAPDETPICASLAESDFDTVLYLRREPCGELDSEVACSDDEGDLGLGVQSALSFVPEPGARYFLFVDGYAGDDAPAAGDYTLELGHGPCRDGGRLRCADDAECPAGRRCDGAACVACVEDGDCEADERCEDAQCVPGVEPGVGACAPERVVTLDGFAVVEGDNADAPTGDVGSCNGGTVAPEVAHRFTAPVAGTVCARTLGTDIDTVLYARRACADDEIACNDDVAGGGTTSAIDLDLEAGETVWLMVDTFTLADFGDYVLAVVPGPCADAPVCPDDPCPAGSGCQVNACVPE